MITRLFGRFDIYALDNDEIKNIDDERIPPSNIGFDSEIGREGYDMDAHSSTSWLVYARDARDNTHNIIRIEPRYLEDSPPLVPNVGLLENAFKATTSDALNGRVLCYYPGDYQESPYGWNERELQVETDRHVRDFADRVSRMKGHFLQDRDVLSAIENDEVHAYINFGLLSRRGNWSVLLIVAEEEPLSIRSGSEAAKHWHIRNQGPTAMGDGRDTGLSTHCENCEGEHLHREINHRDREGNYVEGVIECQKCGNLSKKLTNI